ncbi:MAG: hypothetical protein AMJ53_07485, partial [Gammaproteobacteria bacterium SG8_11]
PDNADFSIPYNSMNLDTNHLNVPPPPVDINSPCFLLWGSGAFCNPNKIATRFPVMAFEKARFAEEIDERQVDCINGNWVATCRIAINYETHIQTIWEKNRWLDVGDVDDMGNPVGFSNYPCIRCHREFNRNDPSLDNPTMVDIPDGQLNLTRTGSHQVRIDSDQFESFLELTGGDDLQKLNATLDGLEYVTEVVVDPNDPNNTQVQNVSVNRCTEQPTIFPQINDVEKCGSGDAMDRGRGGNRNYGYFYSKMTTFDPNRDQIDHSVMLNQAELKMINEWIELGRRYWGDPIDQRDEPPATADTYQ